MKKNFVDIHCHYFNGKFAFRELLEIGWRQLMNNYPYNHHEQTMRAKSVSPISHLKTIIEYTASLLSSLGASAEAQYNYEQKAFKQSRLNKNQTLPIITSPLMMDIYFAVDDGDYLTKKKAIKAFSEDEVRQAMAPLEIGKDEQEKFNSFAEALREEVLNAVKEKQALSKIQPKGINLKIQEVEQSLDDVISEFEYADIKARIATQENAQVQLTRGFRKQLKEIKELKNKYPETVFPFFAVDPRRVGIADLLEENLKNGTFAGVKLYPPLGYLPTHPDLYPIYDLCVKYNIPVTAHCSPGGFHTKYKNKEMKTEILDKNGNRKTIEVIPAEGYDFSKCTHEKCLYFADPNNWVEILEDKRYKNLRINLAHFGGEEQFDDYIDEKTEKENWTAKIIKLIEKYDNVYTDLSYHLNLDKDKDKNIAKNLRYLIEKYDFLQNRLMFGTDFIMILLSYQLTKEKNKALVDYFDHFDGVTEPLFSINALRFLGKVKGTYNYS